MSRLQKKCLIASTGAHVFAGAILLFGAAFAGRHKEDEEVPPMITMIPTRLIDAEGSGGGNPLLTALPAPAPIAAVVAPPQAEIKVEPKPPEPAPPQKTQAEQKPEPKTEPAPPQTIKQNPAPKVTRKAPEPNYDKILADLKDVDQVPPKDNPNKFPKKSKEKETQKTTAPPTGLETKKREIKVNLNPVKPTAPSPSEVAREARRRAEATEKQKAALEAYRSALEQRSAALNGVLARLDKGLSTGTAIEMPGPGGEAFANYGLFVRSVYDSAWSAPADAPEDSAKVQIKVVIARDGQIVSSVIARKSGNANLDKSVQRALNAVKRFPPFPAESSDLERVFIINFDLKAKRQIG